jgi:hypothetical protein
LFVAALGWLAVRQRQSEKRLFFSAGEGHGQLGWFVYREVADAEAAPVAWAFCGGSGAGATRLVLQTEAGTSICHGGECVCVRRNGRNTHAMPCPPEENDHAFLVIVNQEKRAGLHLKQRRSIRAGLGE